MGRRGPETGLGAIRRAFAWRALRLRKKQHFYKTGTFHDEPLTHFVSTNLLPAELSGGLVEPGAHSLLPVFVKVRVQNHAIPAGSHGCSLLMQNKSHNIK